MTPTIRPITARLAALTLAAVTLAAYASAPPPDPTLTPETAVPVRLAPAEQPVAPGDCAEALRKDGSAEVNVDFMASAPARGKSAR